jgi:ureidoglycolate hydrolase
MTDIRTIALEPLSERAFAPFGQVIAKRDDAPTFATATIASWPIAFEVDDRVHLMCSWYPFVTMEFTCIERHAAVTQAFLPLDGVASVMVVAPGGPTRVPEPSEFRAFLVPGDVGLVLGRDVWHALTRFPVREPGATFALLTSAATQVELQEQLATATTPRLTTAHDYAGDGVAFVVGDPRRLL